MALVITTEPAGELLTVEDAKRHLRLFDDSLDVEVAQLIRAARDYCERFTQRTLRTAVLRTLKQKYWWPTGCSSGYINSLACSYRTGGCGELKLPWPPLLASPALVVTYYDTDNASQTLSASNYAVEYSTNGGGRIVWASTATIPALYDRPDAVQIAFSTGYADADALPPVALQAMKTKMTELWAAGTDNENKAAMSATDRLLGMVDWTGYA